jgi:hypothetical protein
VVSAREHYSGRREFLGYSAARVVTVDVRHAHMRAFVFILRDVILEILDTMFEVLAVPITDVG